MHGGANVRLNAGVPPAHMFSLAQSPIDYAGVSISANGSNHLQDEGNVFGAGEELYFFCTFVHFSFLKHWCSCQ